ncbi:unnamed protein product [Ectocarpus sp. CCAP 1310/34]|nr:unnamed protein product [Ectocarpus sp. CCAP 1310/34]
MRENICAACVPSCAGSLPFSAAFFFLKQATDTTGAVETFGAKLHRHLSPANWLKNSGLTGINADGNRRLSWNYGGGSSDSGGGSRDSSGGESGPSHNSGGGK